MLCCGTAVSFGSAAAELVGTGTAASDSGAASERQRDPPILAFIGTQVRLAAAATVGSQLLGVRPAAVDPAALVLLGVRDTSTGLEHFAVQRGPGVPTNWWLPAAAAAHRPPRFAAPPASAAKTAEAARSVRGVVGGLPPQRTPPD